jgi:hypothetical protein
MVERRRVGELGERRQRDAALAEPPDRALERVGVDDAVREAELVLECVAAGVDVDHGHV